MNRLRAKVGFHWDAGGLYCEVLNFTDPCPMEADLQVIQSLPPQDLSGIGLEDIDTSKSYTADITIEYSKSWTACGYEYDSHYTFTNIKEIIGIL